MKKGFFIQIIPEQGIKKVKNFYISKFLFLFVIFLFTGIFIMDVFLIYHFYSIEVDKNKLNFLIKENYSLKERINILEEKRDSLMKMLENITDRLNKLREFAGLEPFEEELLKMGKGGALVPDLKEEDIGKKLDYMLKITEEFDKKIGELEIYVNKKQFELLHTPSILPVESGWITSRFGYRKDPFTGKVKLHEGIDISGGLNSPVYATANGKVIFAGWKRGYGLTVIIDHGNGFRTIYAHNSKLLVKLGQRVKRGDVIALMGRTGRTTGVHVHYEVRLFNKPLNPLNYIIPDHLYYD